MAQEPKKAPVPPPRHGPSGAPLCRSRLASSQSRGPHTRSFGCCHSPLRNAAPQPSNQGAALLLLPMLLPSMASARKPSVPNQLPSQARACVLVAGVRREEGLVDAGEAADPERAWPHTRRPPPCEGSIHGGPNYAAPARLGRAPVSCKGKRWKTHPSKPICCCRVEGHLGFFGWVIGDWRNSSVPPNEDHLPQFEIRASEHFCTIATL